MYQYPISVIIPSYNRGELLFRAIDSVLHQSISCTEILIVDDGSTDGTAKSIAALYSDTAISVKCYVQQNLGPAAARNLGIQHAACDYIAFLDSDDCWHKKKLEKQFKAMQEHPSFPVSHTREKWLRRGVHLNQKKKHIPQHGDIFYHCLQLCAVGMSTVMIEKKLFAKVGMFNDALRCCEDYEFWLRVSCRHPFLLVDEVLTVKHGGREDQVSQQYRVGMDKLRIDAIVSLLAANILKPEQEHSARSELVKKAHIYSKGCLRHGRIEEAGKYLMLADKYTNNPGQYQI